MEGTELIVSSKSGWKELPQKAMNSPLLERAEGKERLAWFGETFDLHLR